jgi:hypothetical protein
MARPRPSPPERERFHQVVVRSAVEPTHAVLDRIARRQHQNWRRHPLTTKLAAHLQSVATRQHHVEHDDVVRRHLGQRLAILSVIGDVDGVARLDQAATQGVLQTAIVFDEEQPHGALDCGSAT